MEPNSNNSEFLREVEGSLTTLAYFICDKPTCRAQNTRKLTKYDRTIAKGSLPIINFEDSCDRCGQYIREPIYIEFNPFK